MADHNNRTAFKDAEEVQNITSLLRPLCVTAGRGREIKIGQVDVK